MSESDQSQEERILSMVKRVLTNVARDTAPRPGRQPPLSQETMMGIRDCLSLISAREREIASEAGLESKMRPRFVDEPKTVHTVSIDSISKKKPN